jgi:hypothetical protein
MLVAARGLSPSRTVFETIARCKKARERAGDAGVYALVLSMLDGPNRSTEVSRLASQADTALNEAKAIPIDVRVSGDSGGRIRAAFTDIFTSAGFKTGSRNSRYALEVTLTAAPAPQNRLFQHPLHPRRRIKRHPKRHRTLHLQRLKPRIPPLKPGRRRQPDDHRSPKTDRR